MCVGVGQLLYTYIPTRVRANAMLARTEEVDGVGGEVHDDVVAGNAGLGQIQQEGAPVLVAGAEPVGVIYLFLRVCGL